MNREQGDIGECLNSSSYSSGDAPATSRAPTLPLPQKRLSSSPKQEDFDLRRAVVSWSSDQINRAQPWKDFADTAKFSIPKSAQEIADRVQSNVGRFHRNYGVLFIVILAGYVMSSVELVVSVAVVAAVGAALKLHQDDESAAVWGTKLVLSKNHRLVAAALVAVPLLYVADIWSAVLWSIGAIVAIGVVHATLYTCPGSPNKFTRKLPDTFEEGDIMGHL
ncbi:prenylated Rab acceptor protein 1-like [Dermacentor variabilis]|uniref:prenylated Rab acceptor protein 1-like n=1 Tax=Dermacentor variabilis TaxID=34621 RepID=UPI003F5C7150